MKGVFLATILIAASGCSVLCGKDFGAQTQYPEKKHEDIANSEPPFSIVGYIVARSICPRFVQCVVPDGVVVSSSNDIEDSFTVYVHCPSAFKIGAVYQFSYHEAGPGTAARLHGQYPPNQ